MILRRLAVLTLACLLGLAGPAFAAEKLYVTDQLWITMREAPTSGSSVVATITSGDLVEVLERKSDGWVLIKLDNGKQGWAQERYLKAEKPANLVLKELNPKAKDMTQEMAGLREENRKLAADLAQAQAELKQADERYQQLKADSGQAVQLRQQRDQLTARNQQLSEQVQQLNADNQSLRMASNVKWFLAGAGVLVLGWLIGLSMGRRKRRWTSSLD